jgi:hypothetical protein
MAVTTRCLTLICLLLAVLCISIQVDADICRKVVKPTASTGSCPLGYVRTVNWGDYGTLCTTRCDMIGDFTDANTGCHDCIKECGVGFCGNSDADCAAVVTAFDGAARAGFKDCPDPADPVNEVVWKKKTGGFSNAALSLPVWMCLDMSDRLGIRAGLIWGAAQNDEATKVIWGALLCDQRICAAWQETHNIVPYVSWGSLPADRHASWNTVDCNHVAAKHLGWMSQLGISAHQQDCLTAVSTQCLTYTATSQYDTVAILAEVMQKGTGKDVTQIMAGIQAANKGLNVVHSLFKGQVVRLPLLDVVPSPEPVIGTSACPSGAGRLQ